MTEREVDPSGLNQHQSGAKLDHGKPRCDLVLGSFAYALLEVAKVGTLGAVKYTDNGWLEVVGGIERYSDAGYRHKLYRQAGEELDPQTQLLHRAHEAWNTLAALELQLRLVSGNVSSVSNDPVLRVSAHADE
jgi:dATP/dGTP diphosphohydrolase, N-terminal